MSIERQPEQSDLSRIGRSLLRRAWVIVACLVVATAAAVLMTVLAQKEYEGTAALLSRAPGAEEPQRVVDTNLQLLSLPAVAERTAKVVPDMTREEVAEAVETKQQGESDVILVTATASDPDRAAELANTFARQFIAFSHGKEENQQTGRTELVDRATPDGTPVSPKPVKNVVFGVLVGLILGIALALLVEQFDRRLKRREDLTEVTGLPLLISIPRREALDERHLGEEPLPSAELEPFRMVRAQLRYFQGRRGLDSVVVTSAQPGEGKTVVSLGLALAAATSGERVLLIEADMRKPVLGRILDLHSTAGLSELLSGDGEASLQDVVTSVETAAITQDVGGRTFDVLPAGAVPPNPTELAASEKMSGLLREATGSYDFVVVDTPPVLTVSDALPLIAATGGVLPVSGIGVSTRNSAADLVSMLEGTGATLVGLIANFSEAPDPARQAYGYGRPPELDFLHTLRGSARPAGEGETETPQR
ncbi:MAG TPA: polysaccharide biosynthesis tyrosine autokinase [Solirubrobacterales bacterium]|nr:polysaccharide biosynthesis tyrosine autokinase [Solirubrobacterales bacterium]